MSLAVGVWVTQAQYDDTGWTVRNNVVSFLDDSDENGSRNIVGYEEGPTTPNAPQEDPRHGKSFTATVPCGGGETKGYVDLLDWWQDYHGNCGLPDYDANLLLSDFDGYWGYGEADGSNYAVANGNPIENLSGDEEYHASSAAGSVGIALMEAAHCFMNVSDTDGDGEGDHDTCDVYFHYYNFVNSYFSTPMEVGYHDEMNETNECGDSYTEPSGDKYVQFQYDNCAMSHM